MAGFTIDLAGRVRNFDLPKNQPLIPLYEAIVNAFYLHMLWRILMPEDSFLMQ